MKLIRTKLEYSDNKFAKPMLICLPAGIFMLVLGIGISSAVCAIIGLILLVLFVIFKIANLKTSSPENADDLTEIYPKLKSEYDSLVKMGVSPATARINIAKDLKQQYEKCEIDVDVYNKLSDYVMNMM